jgi:hypothetical protein
MCGSKMLPVSALTAEQGVVAHSSPLPDGDFALAGESTPQRKLHKKCWHILLKKGKNTL